MFTVSIKQHQWDKEEEDEQVGLGVGRVLSSLEACKQAHGREQVLQV